MCLLTTQAVCVHAALSKAAMVATPSGRVVRTLLMQARRELIASAPFLTKDTH